MISWATQRKLTYISIFIVLVLLVIVWPVYHTFYKVPTCSDGKQNQGELGIDCGGPCSNLCAADALPATIEWARVFEVVPGYYNAVAYINNPNIGSSAKSVSYHFELYDSTGILIAERTGTTNIVAGQKLAVFEPNIETGQKLPDQVLFEFTSTPQWHKETFKYPTLAISAPVLSRESTSPLLQASLTNPTFTNISNLPVVAILYDTDGNAVAVSQTVVSYLQKDTPTPLIFTWPSPFGKVISEKEVIPLLGNSKIANTE